MNKGIILLILLVFLGAMGLVMFLHGPSAPPVSTASSPATDGPAQQGGFASPLQAPQGGSGGLRPIDPPIGVDGAPKPVTLAAGSDARALRPVVPSQPDDSAPPQEKMPEQAPPRPQSAAAEPSAQVEPAQKPAATAPPPNGASGRGGAPGLTAGPTPWSASQQGKGERQNGTSAARSSGTVATAPPASPASGVSAPNPRQPAVLDPVNNGKSLSNTDAHTLRSINLGFSGQRMLLRIEAGDAFPVKTFALTGPDRLVVDFPGSWKGMKAPTVPENNVVSKVRLGDQPAGPRLVLDLKGPLKNHTVERSGNRVDILVK